MRELKMVGLDADGKYILCEGDDPAETFKLPADDRLRALLRGESGPPEQPQLDIQVTNMLSPKEIQARIRAGASVEQVAAASGSDITRIRRFAHPVLLARYRAAELATAAPPRRAAGRAGAPPRRRAGNGAPPDAGRRPGGADPAGNGDRGLGGTRPRPRQAQLGRVARRGQSVDGTAHMASRPFGERGALRLRPWRPRRYRQRDRR